MSGILASVLVMLGSVVCVLVPFPRGSVWNLHTCVIGFWLFAVGVGIGIGTLISQGIPQ